MTPTPQTPPPHHTTITHPPATPTTITCSHQHIPEWRHNTTKSNRAINIETGEVADNPTTTTHIYPEHWNAYIQEPDGNTITIAIGTHQQTIEQLNQHITAIQSLIKTIQNDPRNHENPGGTPTT